MAVDPQIIGIPGTGGTGFGISCWLWKINRQLLIDSDVGGVDMRGTCGTSCGMIMNHDMVKSQKT